MRCHSLAFHAFFLCLTTAMFPVGQEVSSASCYSPLSCGHFLMFCQCRSILLTQRMEVVLLVVGLAEERQVFSYLCPHTHNSDTVVSGCCLFSRLITFLSAKRKKKFVHVDCLQFSEKEKLLFLRRDSGIVMFLYKTRQDNTQTPIRVQFREFVGFVTLLRNVDCVG